MKTRTFASLAAASAAALAVLAGCGESAPDTEMGTIRTEPLPTTEPELPPVEPVTAADCPYLSTAEAADLGGEAVSESRIDESVDPVACFFYGTEGTVILTTTIYSVADPDRAAELVEESAPTGVAEEFTVDGGWIGGSTTGPTGAFVVLSRDNRVLAVQSTGEETGPAQKVAELIAPRVAG